MSCPDCFKGSVHDHATPEGHFETLHGYETYVAGSPSSSTSTSTSTTTTTNATIIYIPDAFGLKLVNNKLLADRYARETGCRVLLPDIIPGGGASTAGLTLLDTIMSPLGFNPWVWTKKLLAVVQMLYIFVPFVIRASPAKVYPSILTYARAVRADLAPGGKLGVCGFCWGGYGSTNLCGEAASPGSDERLVDAQFCAHPSGLKTPGMIVTAISRFNVPYSCAVPEKDVVFTLKAARETEAVLRQTVGSPEEKNYEFVVHKGCTHSFAVRANPGNKIEYQGLEDAANQAVNWFNRFLK